MGLPRSRTLLAEYQRALSLRQMVREFGLTRDTAPDIVAEAERTHGRLHVRNETDDVGELILEGPIWSSDWAYDDEISPANVREALDALGDVKTINVYINSPGGHAFAGHAIYNTFRRHPAHIVGHIDGLAASAASVAAVGTNELVVSANSTFMVHSAMVGLLGWFNAQELHKEGGILEQIDKSLIAAYMIKTGRPEDELRQLVQAETWLVGKEIVDGGFADRMLDGDDAMNVADDPPAPPTETRGDADPVDPIEPEPESDPDPDDKKLDLLALELELSETALF